MYIEINYCGMPFTYGRKNHPRSDVSPYFSIFGSNFDRFDICGLKFGVGNGI